MKKWIVVVSIALIGAAIYLYQYLHQPHRSVAEASAMDIEAPILFNEFQTDENSANAKYLNNVLRVRGKIKSIEKNSSGESVVTLDTGDSMFGINCTLDQSASLHVNDTVVVKGICTGYLSDVVLTKVVIDSKP